MTESAAEPAQVQPGAAVLVGDEPVSSVAGVLRDFLTGHVRRLIVRDARVPQRSVAVPIGWVASLTPERVVLRVGREELDQLPQYWELQPAHLTVAAVQKALAAHAPTAREPITVGHQEGAIELRGSVATPRTRAAASEVARGVPGVGVVRNLLGTRAETAQQAAQPLSSVGYGYPWVHDLLYRASGLDFDEQQATQIVQLAERKLADLFDVAVETALANGRARVFRHDLPLTKGLQAQLREVHELAREVELEPLLVFLADAGVRAPLDDLARAEIPRLTMALLLLAGRVIALVEPENLPAAEQLERLTRPSAGRPTRWELERAARVLDLTL